MRETPQQEIEIKAILDCQLSSDRYEIKDKFAESFKTMEITKEQKKCGNQEILTHEVLRQQKITREIMKWGKHRKLAKNKNGIKI